MPYYVIILAIWNAMVFIIYAVDKFLSKRKNTRRISERTLLVLAFCAGGIGSFLAMKLIRHKTKHRRFVIALPIAFLLTLIAVLAAIDQIQIVVIKMLNS